MEPILPGKLAALLITRFGDRFPSQTIQITSDLPPIVRIVAKSADFGDIEIHDDTEEVSISFGRLTHQHVGAMHCDEPSASKRADRIVNDVIDTLEGVFAEKIEFWVDKGRAGGSQDRGTCSGEVFVWSGRKTNPKT